MSDDELLELINKKDTDALDFLICKYKDLVNSKVNKYFFIVFFPFCVLILMHKATINQVFSKINLDNIMIYSILQKLMKNNVVLILIIHIFSQTSVE